jgi:hypothetical protein
MDDDAPNEIQRATTAAVDALFTVMDKVRPPGSTKEALLSIAAIILAEGLRENWLGEETSHAINATLTERGLPWRLLRPS